MNEQIKQQLSTGEHIAKRQLDFGDQPNTNNFRSNFIKTSKYTVWNFVPFCLFQQFKRYANIYFLVIAILQTIPDISPLNPFSAWAPLIFVISLSMFREGMEDHSRYKSDVEMNSSTCSVISQRQIVEKQWKDIKVGDLCFVKNDEVFPADLVVVSTSILGGTCFIETASLDGEKNLKPKSALSDTATWFDFQTTQFSKPGKVSCIQPTQDLYQFDGTLYSGDQKLLVGTKQFLLRGAKLKNTKWVVGIVVYTGDDTKIMQNANKSKYKQSNLESKTNKLILIILFVQTIISIVCASLATDFYRNKLSKHTYLNKTHSAFVEFIIAFFSYLVLFNTMIPISLIVSMEIVKAIQGFMIEFDKELYCAEKQRGPKVFTCTINEELGQI